MIKTLKTLFLLAGCILLITASKTNKRDSSGDREYWADLLYKISEPILSNMAKGELRKNMTLELSPTFNNGDVNVAYMEAFGRLLPGIAPWLTLPDDDTKEGLQRRQIREWTLASLRNAVDPLNPDYLVWEGEAQALVDAAYIANAFIRAKDQLWEPLDEVTKKRYIEEFHKLRKVKPAYNNWLLFRAMVETFLLMIDEDYDRFAIEVAVRKMDEWYLGDGWYADGPEFSMDYYNGYVMHPMYVEILEVLEQKKVKMHISFDLALRRMQRYNELIERFISPEASYPAVGRSVTYRMGAFQPLALSAWRYELPKTLTNGSVRNALTSVMKRMFSAEGNFDENGYLRLGFVGHQPNIADYYTNTGSLYITSLVFLPLGLPAHHDFWTAPDEEWTSQKAWSGKPFRKDYHESVRQ